MALTEAQKRANNKYKAKAYDQINYRVPRHERLKELVNYASEKAGKSSAQYVVDAIKTQLDKDGITIDQLPAVEDSEQTEC